MKNIYRIIYKINLNMINGSKCWSESKIKSIIIIKLRLGSDDS